MALVPKLSSAGLADINSNSAYEKLKFVEEHYEELMQAYQDIMEHLKLVDTDTGGGSDTHTAYTITDVFDTIIIDPDIIHNILGYTDEEIPIMCKRAGLKYLGTYDVEAAHFDDSYTNWDYEVQDYVTVEDIHDYPARQVPLFAIIKGYEMELNYINFYRTVITKIPVNHKRAIVTFMAEDTGCSDNSFEGNDVIAEGYMHKGILWNCSYLHQCELLYGERFSRSFDEETYETTYTHEGTTYESVAEYRCTSAKLNQVTTSVTTLIDVNDEIYLPEVL